jgi:hypothetical protein
VGVLRRVGHAPSAGTAAGGVHEPVESQRLAWRSGDGQGAPIEVDGRDPADDGLDIGSAEDAPAAAGPDGLARGDLVPAAAFLLCVVRIDEDDAGVRVLRLRDGSAARCAANTPA